MLQFALITFRFGYGRTLKPFMSMISGFSDVSMGPKNQHTPQHTPQHTELSAYEFQKVRTYGLIDFALVDDDYHFPSVETDVHDFRT